MPSHAKEHSAENPNLPGFMAKSDPRRKCTQCGKVMRPTVDITTTTKIEGGATEDGCAFTRLQWSGVIHRIRGYGYNAEGVFCTLTCGYRYALRCVAATGRPLWKS